MYGNAKKGYAAAQRSAEYRRREDEAPRLASEVPTLRSLRIEVAEHAPNGTTKHVKLVVVARAPALFMISCSEAACQDGGHDITSSVMSALRNQRPESRGESTCGGMTGSAQCTRRITYRVAAEYNDPRK